MKSLKDMDKITRRTHIREEIQCFHQLIHCFRGLMEKSLLKWPLKRSSNDRRECLFSENLIGKQRARAQQLTERN